MRFSQVGSRWRRVVEKPKKLSNNGVKRGKVV
jgi:hypothetical protein